MDVASERTQLATDATVAAIRARPPMDPGVPGDCEYCGEWSGRLVEGACAPCRDRYRLWNR